MADGPVPLSDLEIATRILRAASTGPPGDREPTVAQLLAAFDEPQATPAARRRVAAALAMAGAVVTPDLMSTAPTERVRLAPPGRGRRSFSPAQKAGGAAAAIAGLIAIAVVASHHKASDQTADKGLPAGTTAVATKTTPVRTTTTAAVKTTPVAKTKTKTTPAKTTPAKAPVHHHHAAPKHAHDARPKASTRRIKHGVTVRLTPAVPSFVCVDNGRGKVLFNGTLSSPKHFTGHHIRVNIGLRSVVLQVNGHRVHLSQSPTGYDINLHHVLFLRTSRRPCA